MRDNSRGNVPEISEVKFKGRSRCFFRACLGWVVGLLLIGMRRLEAARISDLVEVDFWEQAVRFFGFRDPGVLYVVSGSVLLGISCGMLGAFVLVRRMSMVGDTLSHAVLPGVAIGFLFAGGQKDPWWILGGATCVGLFGTMVVGWIHRGTRLKEDAALGIVLSSFYAIGICLITRIQDLPIGGQSGIDKFLFGQSAAMGREDVWLMGITTGITFLIIVIFFKEWVVVSFDRSFARSIGVPAGAIHHLMMLLTAFAIVVAMQAVGVVLVSAMLVIPAATAYFWTDRMKYMVPLSATFGVVSGVSGAFLSFLGTSMPTGPFMVVSAATLFGISFLISPKYGVLHRWWKQRRDRYRMADENGIKLIYRIFEDSDFQKEFISFHEFLTASRLAPSDAEAVIERLQKAGWITTEEREIRIAPKGRQQAEELVRRHRLWELYLQNAADFAADHVHEDAEKIEHILDEEIIEQLEERLKFPTMDPHGRKIPPKAKRRNGK